MNQHIASAQWIIAMLIGFVIWWPIGAMILGAITFVAICQQITGYRIPQQPQQQRPIYPVVDVTPFDKYLLPSQERKIAEEKKLLQITRQ